jgi:hypothetical protein
MEMQPGVFCLIPEPCVDVANAVTSHPLQVLLETVDYLSVLKVFLMYRYSIRSQSYQPAILV